jgi:hypothetical protein
LGVATLFRYKHRLEVSDIDHHSGLPKSRKGFYGTGPGKFFLTCYPKVQILGCAKKDKNLLFNGKK